MCTLFILSNRPTAQPAYQLKVKNVHNLAIFQPICLKLGMETLNEKNSHFYLIWINLSIFTGQTGVPLNWPIDLIVKVKHA